MFFLKFLSLNVVSCARPASSVVELNVSLHAFPVV